MSNPYPKLAGQGGCYCGRRGLPREWVLQMYADYLRLGSLEKVGRLHRRTRQGMYGIFKTHGLKLRAKLFHEPIVYRGRKYTPDGKGYLRDTVFRSAKYNAEALLHRRVWMDLHGPIPPGHDVTFKDGNRSNCDPGNLELLTHPEQQARTRKGENHSTKTARARLDLLLAGRGRQVAEVCHGPVNGRRSQSAATTSTAA